MTATMNNGTVRPVKVAPMPEFLTRKDHQGTAWTIEEGQPVRGDAWTNTVEARMRVPMGADEISRIVRAHEMSHAKFSPLVMHHDGRYGATTESIIVAEEYRVNTLLAKAGFDIDNLADGSETKSGEIVGENNDWNGAIRFATAVAGTKASASFVRGVAKTNPKMAESLRAFNKALKKRMKRAAAHRKFGSTEPTTKTLPDGTEFTYPVGFNASVKLAEFIDSFLIQDGMEDGDTELPQEIPDPDEIKEASEGGSRGKFARLIVKNIPKPETVSGRLGRKRMASDIGKNPRRMERMLTDPDRRVFDRWSRASGGVVLIDQSGSMSLSHDDIWSMIKSAPGCVIIGYSHRPGSTTEPNAWVLAERGKVIKNLDQVPQNMGNGVDGPALRFAQTKRKKGEPLIWVCDGIVTDGASDTQHSNLDRECVKLVRQYRVHMVPNVDEAVKALKRASEGANLPARLVGSLRRYANG